MFTGKMWGRENVGKYIMWKPHCRCTELTAAAARGKPQEITPLQKTLYSSPRNEPQIVLRKKHMKGLKKEAN